MKNIEEDHQREIEQIKMELHKLDEKLPVYTPDLEWFKQQISITQVAAKKKFLHEIVAFLILSVIVVSLFILMMYRIPIVFIAFQLMVLLGSFIGYLYAKRKRRVVKS